eukprot:TRINITY_DN27990_c0_g1_i1.p1 TRINITY_DN27990_c0_g1~~TRINITY_DN27990_c0_g1_i1.p1  ORF type:complete len:231 (+),score=23.40 TRINITY_DN27990_c0_g1_i1:58-750(+)
MTVLRKDVFHVAAVVVAVSLNLLLQGCGNSEVAEPEAPSAEGRSDRNVSTRKNFAKTPNMSVCLNSKFECQGNEKWCAKGRAQCEQARLLVNDVGDRGRSSSCIRAAGTDHEGLSCHLSVHLRALQAVSCKGDSRGGLISDECFGAESWCAESCRQRQVGCVTFYNSDDDDHFNVFAFGSKESCLSKVAYLLPKWDFSVRTTSTHETGSRLRAQVSLRGHGSGRTIRSLD